MTVLVVMDVDGIAGGTGNWRNDITFLAHKGVDDRRFTNVRPADYGKFWQGVFFGRLFVKMLYHFVEQFAGTGAGHRGYVIYLTQAKAIEYGAIVLQSVIIHFIRYYEYRFFAFAQ